MVMDQNVAGTSGWWMCSLYGRHGMAPANRLQLLPHTRSTADSPSQVTERDKSSDATMEDSVQNIYQIPSVPRNSSSQQCHAYERMDMFYKTPSAPSAALKCPPGVAPKNSAEGPEENKVCMCMCSLYRSLSIAPEVNVGLLTGEVLTLMIRGRLLQKCNAMKPLLVKRAYRWGPGAPPWGRACSTGILMGL